jgi:hypothetical protein
MSKYLFLSLILMVGCVSTDKVMQSWIGQHESGLYQAWGPPAQITENGNGGRILIYGSTVYQGQVPGQIQHSGDGNYSYTAHRQISYQRTRMFNVRENGVIYGFRWQGM